MEAWCDRTGHRRGATLTLEQMWAVARRWYDGRMEEAWTGRSPAEAAAILGQAGLTGPFWSL